MEYVIICMLAFLLGITVTGFTVSYRKAEKGRILSEKQKAETGNRLPEEQSRAANRNPSEKQKNGV